jgi:hypothetical protein
MDNWNFKRDAREPSHIHVPRPGRLSAKSSPTSLINVSTTSWQRALACEGTGTMDCLVDSDKVQA